LQIDGKGVLRLFTTGLSNTLKASFNLTLWTTANLGASFSRRGSSLRSFRISFKTEEGDIHFAFETAKHRQLWMKRMTAFMDESESDEDAISTQKDARKLKSQYKPPSDPKLCSLLLVGGYVREMGASNVLWATIPSSVIPVFHKFYFEPIESLWSDSDKMRGVTLSEEAKKVTIHRPRTACRVRNPIERGMIAEWTVDVQLTNAMFLGVVSSNCFKFNLVDMWGSVSSRDQIWMGNWSMRREWIPAEAMCLWVDESERPVLGGWKKPIKLRLDYKTHSFATLTYWFDDGKMAKMPGKEWTFQLTQLDEEETWFLCVDFVSKGWCQIIDFCVE